MSAIGLGILGAGIAATSSLSDSLVKFKSQQDTNNQNLNLTMNQWARDDNAVQRRVKDLIKAGLSPTLAAGSAAASSSAMRMESPAKDFKQNLGEAFMTGMSIKQMSEQIKNTEANTNNVNEDTNNKKLNGQLLSEQYIKIQKENLLLDFQKDLTKLNIVGQDLTNKERFQAIENLKKDYIMKDIMIEGHKISNQQNLFNYQKDKYDSDYMYKNFGTYEIKNPIISDLAHLLNGGNEKLKNYFNELLDDSKPFYKRIF